MSLCGKIDKVIVFCNTVATKNSAKLGYYPGTRDEKLLDSQIGNLLSSKLGGRLAVEQMIQEEKLILLPHIAHVCILFTSSNYIH